MGSESLLALSTRQFARKLLDSGTRRLWIATGSDNGTLQNSSPDFAELDDFLVGDARDFRKHEALFLQADPETESLFGVFVHTTHRGQAQGGVRNWRYPDVESFLRDGLRLSVGMGRKCALADLWWGGGKGVIAADSETLEPGSDARARLFREFGSFVTSLRGAYITAEDAGTTPDDLAEVHRETRFATCLPISVGGSGNPSAMTAAGVIRAMEAALAFRGLGGLEGKKIAMQGAGNVGAHMIERLFELGAARVVVTDLCKDRCTALQDRFPGDYLRAGCVEPGDLSIFSEPCDIFSPNALGAAIGPKTIDLLQTKIVCGAANNALVEEHRDADALEARGITYVPDYVANRMGIVSCANEQSGILPDDPFVMRHLEGDGGWESSIYNVSLAILREAQNRDETSARAAETLADVKAREPHPIWGHRGRAIIDHLIHEGWEHH